MVDEFSEFAFLRRILRKNLLIFEKPLDIEVNQCYIQVVNLMSSFVGAPLVELRIRHEWEKSIYHIYSPW